MATYSGAPPADLTSAIDSASKTYGVPADVLLGIWRIESGSTYPNPYVNSSGYGGLFGTTDWNGSTQDQANLAASILAKQIKDTGSLSSALSNYSGGGYTSVPGQTTEQAATSLGTAPSYSRGTRPAGGGGSVVSGLFGDAEGLAGDALGGLNSGAEDIVPGLGQVEGLFGSATGAIGDAKDALKVFLWLFSPVHWLMAFEILFGSLLMILGLFFLGQEAAGIESREDIGGVKDVAKTIGLGALIPVAGEAKVTKAAIGLRSARKAARPSTSREGSTAGPSRRVALPVDRKPARGEPGSSRLARGDTIPY